MESDALKGVEVKKGRKRSLLCSRLEKTGGRICHPAGSTAASQGCADIWLTGIHHDTSLILTNS